MGTFEEFFIKPDIEQLKRENPELSDLLIGEFGNEPGNFYGPQQEGTVVSWILNQGKGELNPTYGRLPLGHFEFSTTYTETIHILKGEVKVKIKKGGKMSWERTVTRGQQIIAPPKSMLILDVESAPAYYLCQYEKTI